MDFCLYLITDRRAAAKGRSIEEVVERALEAGVKGLLLREKDLPDREILSLAQRLRDITLRHRVRLLISGRADIAAAVDADGVHVSSKGLSAGRVREVIGPSKYMAVSTHTIEEARAAQEDGADFITYGPVFYTPSKAAYGPPVGLGNLERVCAEIKVPVFALGGIKGDNAVEALKAGAFGVAVISAVIAADDPAHAAKCLIDKVRSFKMRSMV